MERASYGFKLRTTISNYNSGIDLLMVNKIKLPTRLYFTGVPGSKWSGIAQLLENTGLFNITDRTPEREYNHNQYSGHKGAYFGTGMEFEADFTCTDQAWSDPTKGTMIVKSHEWANQLDMLTEHIHESEDWIMLILRSTNESHLWWYEAGGFDITYPNYDYYKNTMYSKIAEQNDNIRNYVSNANHIEWEYFTNDWVYKNFGIEIMPCPKFKDIRVVLIKV